jgi:uncharacterized glyoxalase superfamily protein PhnB
MGAKSGAKSAARTATKVNKNKSAPLRRAAPAKAAPAAKKPAKAVVKAKAAPKKAAPAPSYHTVTPFLSLKDAAAAIDFYKTAFGATERMRMPGPGGVVMHCELMIGDSVVMLAEAMQDPASRAGLHVYVPDCDALFAQALAAGATVKRPLEDMFWGDRYGQVTDPFGINWSIATHVRDVSPEEMQEKMAAMGPPPGAPS